ncbi:MAG: hypothetical protein DWP95_03330 [Proteobacteria bacterium]|nr:MAG: hypothetical protein DWP95_03330 [Pseudomonadota bacterium]
MNKSQLYKTNISWLALILTMLYFLVFSIPNLVKGFYGPNVWGQYLWFVSYEHGFIKRGLLGTIFQFFFGDFANETQQIILVVFYSFLVCLFFAVLFFHLIYLVYKSTVDSYNKVFYLGLVCFLSITPLWPTLANTTGYPDLFVFIWCYLGLIGFLYRKWRLIIISIVFGILTHEAFLFCWLSVLFMILYEYLYVQKNRTVLKILIISLVLPVVVYFVIGFNHNNDALKITLNQISFLSEENKHLLYTRQFNQGIYGAFIKMINIITNNFYLFVIKALYFLLMPLVFFVILSLSTGSKYKTGLPRNVFYFLVIFSPLSILFFAWDLSRLLSYASYGATLLLIYILTKNLLINHQVKLKLMTLGIVLLCSVLFYVRAPLVYAYFNKSAMVGVGQYVFDDTLGKDISAWIVENDFRTMVNKNKSKNRVLYTKTIDGEKLKIPQSQICFVCGYQNDYILNKQLEQICTNNLCDYKPGVDKQLQFREYQRMYSGEYVIELHYSSPQKNNVPIGDFEVIVNGQVLQSMTITGTDGVSKTASTSYVLNKNKFNAALHLFDLNLMTNQHIMVEKLVIELVQ